jgi:saccharopepsin
VRQLASSIPEPPSFSLPLVGVLYDIKALLIHRSDAFDKYQSATGGTPDEGTGLLQISSDQYDKLSSLYFITGGGTYELTPNAQIWPRSLNTAIGGTTDSIYLVISSTGSSSGSGLDFTNGYCFLYDELYFLPVK